MHGAGAATAAAMAQAIKASGAVVHVEPAKFLRLVQRGRELLVVPATGGIYSTKHQYLSRDKGFVFLTKTPRSFDLPGSGEVIQAGRIRISQ